MIHLLPCGAKDEFVMLWWQIYTIPFCFYVCYNKLLCCSWRVTQLDFLTTCWFMDQPHILETYFANSLIWIASEQEACTWVWWHVKPHEKMGHQIIPAEMWLEWEILWIWNIMLMMWIWNIWMECLMVSHQCGTSDMYILEVRPMTSGPQDHENLVLDTSGRNPNHSSDSAGCLLNGSRLYVLCRSWPCSELGLWHSVSPNWHPLRYVCVLSHWVYRAHFPSSVCQL